MGNDIAKRPATVIRGYTQVARDLGAAHARAWDKYVAAMARCQAQYVEDCKRITGTLTDSDVPVVDGAADPDGGGSAPRNDAAA